MNLAIHERRTLSNLELNAQHPGVDRGLTLRRRPGPSGPCGREWVEGGCG
jgi:hypothetical protein